MGEIDEAIITGCMNHFGISRAEVEKMLDEMIKDGEISRGLDNNMITPKGIKFALKDIKDETQ